MIAVLVNFMTELSKTSGSFREMMNRVGFGQLVFNCKHPVERNQFYDLDFDTCID